ncbi:27408_t:CDS:2 [Gigaspora margarita]|uniref:27408_t:CDS:1 n=1 Tax=Gigaspora margarita TaxID=4874 RepID=A0ABN7V9U8_GIGMA|nr:27408_t:CDS:2 [Gigaspora margarita]
MGVDEGIDLTGCYNKIFFAIQTKFRTDHYNEQDKDIKNFDKAFELQPKEVIRFFVTTIDYSEESKNAALEAKRKIFLCNEENVVQSIKNLSNCEIKKESIDKNAPHPKYLNELIRIKNILQNSKDKVLIKTKNKNIYLMLIENRIDKWERNSWYSIKNKKIKAPKEICIEIRNLYKKKQTIELYYIKNKSTYLLHDLVYG